MYINRRLPFYVLTLSGILLLPLGAMAENGAPPASSKPDEIKFNLVINSDTLKPCLAQDPSSEDPKKQPKAKITVKRGKLNDTMTIKLRNIKPGLAFDLFTIQNSPKLAGGGADPDFAKKGFGLAWYQTDLEVDDKGQGEAKIKTILLDQIFGLNDDKADTSKALPPINTFHVGFWFNDPNDAAACGFDVTKPTPFNGEHKAGPLAMVSVPAKNGLGPLCTDPDPSDPAKCNP